ncbi:hypothetical protein OJ997_10335 [Solirubrobacter phytolaccae]|uniref:Uncharacterized protein n=1 Tax=Solirubrobacter phytolaccae TaxID=1404360 RepID=A0A9X3N955_9ACTN|nr:hypothetical protein [Solirubrobacter phytolaccae]MDA0180690.1 hypothetical protein [Solirubrobacter phytolaccae]
MERPRPDMNRVREAMRDHDDRVDDDPVEPSEDDREAAETDDPDAE